MEMAEETRKIVEALNLLAPQGALRKSVISAPSPKKYVELWWKKPPDFKEEKPKRTIGGRRSDSRAA